MLGTDPEHSSLGTSALTICRLIIGPAALIGTCASNIHWFRAVVGMIHGLFEITKPQYSVVRGSLSVASTSPAGPYSGWFSAPTIL